MSVFAFLKSTQSHAPNRRVWKGDAALAHHLNVVARAQLVTEIPPDAQDNDLSVEMPTRRTDPCNRPPGSERLGRSLSDIFDVYDLLLHVIIARASSPAIGRLGKWIIR